MASALVSGVADRGRPSGLTPRVASARLAPPRPGTAPSTPQVANLRWPVVGAADQPPAPAMPDPIGAIRRVAVASTNSPSRLIPGTPGLQHAAGWRNATGPL